MQAKRNKDPAHAFKASHYSPTPSASGICSSPAHAMRGLPATQRSLVRRQTLTWHTETKILPDVIRLRCAPVHNRQWQRPSVTCRRQPNMPCFTPLSLPLCLKASEKPAGAISPVIASVNRQPERLHIANKCLIQLHASSTNYAPVAISYQRTRSLKPTSHEWLFCCVFRASTQVLKTIYRSWLHYHSRGAVFTLFSFDASAKSHDASQ